MSGRFGLLFWPKERLGLTLAQTTYFPLINGTLTKLTRVSHSISGYGIVFMKNNLSPNAKPFNVNSNLIKPQYRYLISSLWRIENPKREREKLCCSIW